MAGKLGLLIPVAAERARNYHRQFRRLGIPPREARRWAKVAPAFTADALALWSDAVHSRR